MPVFLSRQCNSVWQTVGKGKPLTIEQCRRVGGYRGFVERRMQRRHGKEFAAAVVECGGVDDVELPAVNQVAARTRNEDYRQYAYEALHAALHLSAIVGAGDDFLSGVAALGERHGADAVEVEHLRDEPF